MQSHCNNANKNFLFSQRKKMKIKKFVNSNMCVSVHCALDFGERCYWSMYYWSGIHADFTTIYSCNWNHLRIFKPQSDKKNFFSSQRGIWTKRRAKKHHIETTGEYEYTKRIRWNILARESTHINVHMLTHWNSYKSPVRLVLGVFAHTVQRSHTRTRTFETNNPFEL